MGGRSVSLHPRWRSNTLDADGLTPGPASYLLDHAHQVVFEKTPKFSFGTSSRPNPGSSNTPGPGQYGRQKSSLTGPMFSMKRRIVERNHVSNTPGPGAFGGITSFG